MTIKDKVAIITGASSGIGFATALTLSKAGAKIAAGARRVDKLQQLENEIKNIGGDILVQRLDVTKKSNCYDIVDQTIKKWGTVDILVNNAGIMPISLIEKRKVKITQIYGPQPPPGTPPGTNQKNIGHDHDGDGIPDH